MVEIRPGDPCAPGARALLEQSHALMRALYPPESNHYLKPEALKAPGITFLVAVDGEEILGTGALADRGDYGEIKSMFIAPKARGRGIADAMLRALESRARALGHGHLRLETGPELAAAVRLYTRHGFAKCGPFGDYAPDPLSLFMEKSLT